MTELEARFILGTHAGRTENFMEGYVYALRYGIKSFEKQQRKFDEIFECLKKLEKIFYCQKIEREILEDLCVIQYQSILYINNKNGLYTKQIQILTEVLAETIVYLLENVENPFEAYENYKINYEEKLL